MPNHIISENINHYIYFIINIKSIGSDVATLQVRVIKKRKEVKMDRQIVFKKISYFLVKESVLYHSWVRFEDCKFCSARDMHTNLHKALEVTFTSLSISLKYFDIFRTDEGQVTEKLSSLIPEHSQCSSDLKVPDPVSRQLSYPTAKAVWNLSLTDRQIQGLCSQNHHQEKHSWTLPLLYWDKVYTCQINIKN